MSSITTQIHSLAAEVKARFYQTMVRLHVQLTINKRNVIKKQITKCNYYFKTLDWYQS